MLKKLSLVILLISVFFNFGCSSTTKITNFQGLSTPHGEILGHVQANRLAFHLFGRWQLIGDSTVNRTMEDFFIQSKLLGATKVNISDTDRTFLWYGFPPFTFALTPVLTTVSGDALSSTPNSDGDNI